MSRPPKVVILHYHLRRGGVSRVIETAQSVLTRLGVETMIFSGEAPHASLNLHSVQVVPGLLYAGEGSDEDPGKVMDEVQETVREAWGQADCWHIHNHCLGKNRAVPDLVRQLALQGEALLLQPHDFAEDGRPANYRFLLDACPADGLGEWLYPQGAHVHYAVLNGRDRSALVAAGVPGERLHLLPNAIPDDFPRIPSPVCNTSDRLVLYPTRAIRRKNIGELLLWAALAPEGTRFGVTLAPENPASKPIYERWVRKALEWKLPVDFEMGRDTSFQDMLAKADQLISTSVAEGFGLAFLESWLSGRALAGRNLPAITDDFSAKGLDLSDLYDRIDVPVSWIGEERIEAAMSSALTTLGTQYDREVDPWAWKTLLRGEGRDRIDFGVLDEPLQGVEVRIEGPDDSGAGELWVKGPNVMLGYVDEAQTREVMQDGWYKTGDIARLVDGRKIVLTGRSKRLIVTEAGKNVYPEDLEIMLERHPDLKEAGVVEVDMRPAAVLAIDEPDQAEKARAIIKEFNARVSSHNHIVRYAIVEELPRTPLGKVALKDLPAIFEANEVQQ